MRILLDECLPAELADEIPGHEVRTVQQAGWSGVDNGALLQRAAGQFDVFVTIDKHIERTHELPGTLAVITIKARANRIETRPLVAELGAMSVAPGPRRRPGPGVPP